MRLCSDCGGPVDGQNCPFCGKPIEPGQPQPRYYYYPPPPPTYYGQYQPPVPKGRDGIAIAAALLVVLVIVVASIGSAIVLSGAKSSQVIPNKYAVVIGISDYSGAFSDLSYCDDDARTWESYLESKGYLVKTLINYEATGDAIFEAIDWMDDMDNETSQIVFTFSGHGGYSASQSYICPYDTSSFSYDHDISDSQLAAAFEGFESQHMFFFFDSCNSGGMDGVAGPGRYVSQSSAADEESFEDPGLTNGIWTYYFVEWGLEERGYEDVAECFDAAYPQALRLSRMDYQPAHPEEEYWGTEPFYL